MFSKFHLSIGDANYYPTLPQDTWIFECTQNKRSYILQIGAARHMRFWKLHIGILVPRDQGFNNSSNPLKSIRFTIYNEFVNLHASELG